MSELELPARRTPALPLGAVVRREEIGGTEYWTVTVFGVWRVPRRRWFPARPDAVAYAATVADEHGVPMFDTADEVEPE